MIHFNDHALLLNESYRHWMGEYLVQQSDPGAVLETLNQSDFVLVSHGLEANPTFNYGNLSALSMFGCDLQEFLQLASKDTVPEADLEARSQLTLEVETKGYVPNYCGVRLGNSGRKWKIEHGVVWQLIDNLGRIHGHAACFTRWTKIV